MYQPSPHRSTPLTLHWRDIAFLLTDHPAVCQFSFRTGATCHLEMVFLVGKLIPYRVERGEKFWKIPNCWKSLWEGMIFVSKNNSSLPTFQERFPRQWNLEFSKIFPPLSLIENQLDRRVLKKFAIIILVILSIDIIVPVWNKRSKNKFLLIDIV